MSDHIEHTTFDDLAGREVTWADPGAPHQLDLRMDSDPTDCIVGCTCGAQRVRQRMDAPIAEMWLAYNTLDHIDRRGGKSVPYRFIPPFKLLEDFR